MIENKIKAKTICIENLQTPEIEELTDSQTSAVVGGIGVENEGRYLIRLINTSTPSTFVFKLSE